MLPRVDSLPDLVLQDPNFAQTGKTLELIVQHFVAGVSFEWENFAVGSWVTNHAFFRSPVFF